MMYFISDGPDGTILILTGGEKDGVLVDEAHQIRDGDNFLGRIITRDMVGQSFDPDDTRKRFTKETSRR